jgi:hypothetical protein
LTGLSAATLYHYKVTSAASSTSASSGDATFVTFPGDQAIPQCTYANLRRYGSGYAVDITMFNAGDELLAVASVNAAALGLTASPSGPALPYKIQDLSPGNSQVFTLYFPGSAGADGLQTKLSFAGGYTVTPVGPSEGTFSFTWRVTLP